MQTYSQFRPTGFDAAGLALDNRQDWLVIPCSRTRDSGILDQSNFEAAVQMMGGESDTVEIHRFGHWACGWFEIIICHPTRAMDAEAIHNALADYPLLNEDDHSKREWEAACERWDAMSYAEKKKYCVECGIPVNQARRKRLPDNMDISDFVRD